MKKVSSTKSYLTFTKNVFQKKLAYKSNTIMFILGDMMILAVTYYLWKAIYSSADYKVLNDFNYKEMIIYILLSFMTQCVVGSDIGSTISREVRNGSIASNLIKPISYEKRMLFEGLGNLIYSFVLVFIIGFSAILILAYSYGNFPKISQIILYIISIIFSYFINFYYSYSMGLLTFKITNMWGVNQVMEAITALFSGALIPITFFPQSVQKIFDFFPFKSIVYTPCMILQGKFTGLEIVFSMGQQLIWIVIMMIIGKKMYSSLIKSLTILGG